MPSSPPQTTSKPAAPSADTLSVIGPSSEPALHSLAPLAPALKEAELRVALQLALLRNSQDTVSVSSRKLAELCHLTRDAVKRALHSLTARRLITTRQGDATTAAAYLLNFLQTIPIGGLPKSPPLGLQKAHPGITKSPPLGSSDAHPPTQPQPLTTPAPPLDIDAEVLPIIDRVLRANPKRCDPVQLKQARDLIWGYTRKFRDPNALAPSDDVIPAQLLAVAPWTSIQWLFQELMAQRQEPGASYAWYVTVALQRIHGIHWEAIKARRAQLKPPARATTATASFAEQLIAQTVPKLNRLK